MGVSDRPYFEWLTGALDRFERAQGRLAALGRERSEVRLWGLAEQRETPGLQRLRAAVGDRATVTLFDKFPDGPGVQPVDLDRLDALPDAACDVVTLFRASMFVTDAPGFLHHLRRLLRPGGLAAIDWLHGCSDAPVLDFPLDPRYGGAPSPLVSTYMDAAFLAAFPDEFDRFIKDVNRPPWSANLARPGRPVGVAGRLLRLAECRRSRGRAQTAGRLPRRAHHRRCPRPPTQQRRLHPARPGRRGRPTVRHDAGRVMNRQDAIG